VSVLHFLLRASFLGGLLFTIALSGYVLHGYARRALRGDPESRWLGRHITAIASAHLLLLTWATARFVASWQEWSWPWVATLGVIIALSDYGIAQIYLYRRWLESRIGDVQ
jgi:hypothetical protein